VRVGEFVKRLLWVRRLAWVATGFVCLATLGAFLYWPQTSAFIREHDTLFKLVGLGIGPFLAILGFFWGLADKAELRDLAEKLGDAKRMAEDERKAAERAENALKDKVDRIESLERDLETVADAGRLWKLRKNQPFIEYKGWKYDPEGAKIVTVSLFKGGVAKTHLAANFAAYVSEKHQKPVLLIDLDYQGSLSFAVLTAAGIEPVGSNVDALFEPDADLATLSSKRIHLARTGDATVLNEGKGLSRAWLVPADYTLAQVESRLLVERVIHDRKSALDERYRLAHLLLQPSVRREYAMVVIDTPPRMTLGTVNAFVASHYYIVPTILDRVSSEAVRPFLTQVESLKHDLELDLKLAGIVGTLTRAMPLASSEAVHRDQIVETAKAVLNTDVNFMVAQNMPRKAQVTNENDLGYFLSDAQGRLQERFYDAIFDELWTRIMSPQNQAK
jgi:chromosome partitioning protein